MSKEKVLEVKNLHVALKKKDGHHIEIIRNIEFSLHKGECLGILGESGSGKSMSMKAILGLLDKNFICTGSACYRGKNLLKQSSESLRKYRGKEIAMILQNPMTVFDPLYRIGDQIAETWLAHKSFTKEEIYKQSLYLLERMQIANAKEVLHKYPHQLSGGMLQRVTIGLALSMEPDIIVADEPTTAIDAITQYEIMKEFQKIKDSKKTSIIFITHDLGVISQIADKILVMNQGEVVDRGNFKDIITSAKDSYTQELVKSKMMVVHRYHQILHAGGSI